MKMKVALSVALAAGMAVAAEPAKEPGAASRGGAGETGASAERAQKQAAARAKRMLSQAKSALADGETERAISVLEAIPKMFPDSEVRFAAFLELGRLEMGRGRGDDALAQLRKVEGAESPEVRAEALLLQAKVQIAAGRDSEASMVLRRLTSDFPDSPFANDAWFEIGQIHFKAKRWTRAQEAFRRVGTAVPKADGGAVAVFAEAGQNLYVCVDDRDIAVATALGKEVEVEISAASGDSEKVALRPFGTDGSSAIASVRTTASPGAKGDGVLTVQGGEQVTVAYTDEANSAGARNVKLTAPVRIVSTAVLAVMDGAYRQNVNGVFAGSPAFLRLRDLDLDATAKADSVKVRAVSYRRRPKPTAEELAEAAAKGEEIDVEADPWIEIASCDVALTETAPRSGVFEGRLVPVIDGAAGEGSIAASDDGKLVFSFTDERHLGGAFPREVKAEVAVLSGGSAEPQSIVSSASDPVLQSRKLLLEARLLNQWATIFKEVGLEQQAAAKADEGLGRVGEIFQIAKRQAVLREVMEQAYAAKWDLLLVKNDLNGAIAACRELLRVYPDTTLADVAFLRIARARAESRDANGLQEAARIYRSVLAMPKSPNRAEAQYLLAGVLEKIAKRNSSEQRPPDYTAAIAAYRACAENYPQSSFAGESFKRIVTWQIEKKDFSRAVETLERVMQDYPDAPWLDEMLLRWGIVCYRQGDREGAAAKFRRILEEYPSGSASAQAQGFLERLK